MLIVLCNSRETISGMLVSISVWACMIESKAQSIKIISSILEFQTVRSESSDSLYNMQYASLMHSFSHYINEKNIKVKEIAEFGCMQKMTPILVRSSCKINDLIDVLSWLSKAK